MKPPTRAAPTSVRRSGPTWSGRQPRCARERVAGRRRALVDAAGPRGGEQRRPAPSPSASEPRSGRSQRGSYPGHRRPAAADSADRRGRCASARRARRSTRACWGRAADGGSCRRARRLGRAHGRRAVAAGERCIGLYFTLYSRCRMATFRRLLGFLRPHRRALWGSLVFAWAAMGMTVLIPWLVGQAVDAIEQRRRGRTCCPLALAIIGAGDPAPRADRGPAAGRRQGLARGRVRPARALLPRTCRPSSSGSSTASRRGS